jgi:hypothetical protein
LRRSIKFAAKEIQLGQPELVKMPLPIARDETRANMRLSFPNGLVLN